MNSNVLYEQTVSELLDMGSELFNVAKEFYNLNVEGLSEVEVAQECAKIEVENFFH